MAALAGASGGMPAMTTAAPADAATMQQVRTVEQLAAAVGSSSTTKEQRSSAQAQLTAMGKQTAHIPLIRAVMDHSNEPAALQAAANALTQLVTDFWTSYTVPQRVELRDYLLSFLANRGPNMVVYVIAAFIKLLCRITKYGWFDEGHAHRKMVDETKKFLQATMPHCIIGLRILNELVTEINTKMLRRSVTEHRRIAVAFRDQNLYAIFELGLTVLNQVATRTLPLSGMDPSTAATVEDKILGQALQLCMACMTFDFIGTSPDESTEDVGTLQIPTAWREKFEKPDYLAMLFSLYEGAATGQIRMRDAGGSRGAAAPMINSPARAAQVLELLTMFMAARRSLFRSDGTRKNFLLLAMSGLVEILKGSVGLGHSACYHRFCQLLGRLKANYQLTELVNTEVYPQWVELTAAFTTESLGNLHQLSDSIHYLLTLWSRLVSAVPYVRSTAGGSASTPGRVKGDTLLTNYAPRVLKTFLEVRLQLAQLVAQGQSDNEDLDSSETAILQAEQLPGMFRFQYRDSVTTLTQALDQLSARHESLANMVGSAVLAGAATAASDPNVAAGKASLGVVEAQLAWLVYFVGAIIGDAPFGASSRSEGDEKLDAALCKRVIALMVSIDNRLGQTGGAVKCDYRLELAMLYFLSQFRKTYFVESRGMPTPPPAIGGTTTQPMLDAGAAAAAGSGEDTSLTTRQRLGAVGSDPSSRAGRVLTSVAARAAQRQTAKQKLFDSLFAEMGLGDHLVVASSFISKLANNLKHWPGAEEVLGKTLDVFQEMTHSYSSGKLLLALEVVNSLLLHHTPEHFRFLGPLENGRLRTRFYLCVARLLYISEDPDVMFERFMSPLAAAMDTVQASISVKSDAVGMQVAGVCRDLRGVIAAAHNPRTFTLVFEVLYPKYFDMLVAAAGAWVDVPQVTTPLLKMLAELVHNRSHRINFGASSPNGILLFREVSRVTVAYGQALSATPPPQAAELWAKRYKGIAVVLTMLARILDGSYVNFGVFDLYDDPSLKNCLEVALQLALGVPDTDLMTFPKLARAFYYFIHTLTKGHLKRLVGIPAPAWKRIMEAVREGLETDDATIANHASYALDYTATAFVQHARKDSETGRQLREQVAKDPGVFDSMMKLLFQLVVFGESSTQWAMTRPMLPLILAADMVTPRSWDAFKESLTGSQPVEGGVRAQLIEELGKLMKDITRSLDSPNRDRFSQRLSSFRMAVRTFVKL